MVGRNQRPLSVGVLVVFVALTVLGVFVGMRSSGATFIEQADASAGRAVYAAQCASCHQADGSGIAGSFPPLANNPNAADPAYVEKVIREGRRGAIEVNGQRYDSVMPAMSGLSDAEVANVAAYVAALASGSAPTPTTAPIVPIVGNAGAGERLFTGASAFAAGTGSCGSCHSAGDVSALGGQTLGPDLTGAVAKFGGEPGLTAWLKNPPSLTMTPIFATRPMSEQEIADVVAFLAQAPKNKTTNTTDWLQIGGGIGLVVLLALMAIFWRGGRRPYVEKLRSPR